MNTEDWLRALAALALVLFLASGIGWLVRRSGLAGTGNRPGRRLSLVEVLAIDNRRRLVLVRRDDVEHLLLIGGESDMVVETRIVQRPESPPT